MQTYIRNKTEKYDLYLRDVAVGIIPQLQFILLLFLSGLLIGLFNIFNINYFIHLALANIIQPFKDYHGFYLFINILFHNLKAAAIAIYSGIFFAVVPTLSTIINGTMIGALPSSMHVSKSLSTIEMYLCLVPHGVFEIPALIIATAMGIKLGSWPFKRNKKEFIKRSFKEVTVCYIKIIIPLFFFAAIIETIGIETWRI